MKNQPISRLEAHLEQVIEGAFANLFGKRIRAQDIAMRLARAMESGLRTMKGNDPRPLAPDLYTIFMHPDVQDFLLSRNPSLPQTLAEHMIDLATQAGYRLNGLPQIKILADTTLDTGELMVQADHTDQLRFSTAAMQPVKIPPTQQPKNPQLITDDNRSIPLTENIINIGRSLDNQIVLDDPQVSRHHLQLRVRFGTYILFDIHSQSGTFVNGISVKEHHLKSGDVVRIGQTQMIYLEEDAMHDAGPETGEIGRVETDL